MSKKRTKHKTTPHQAAVAQAEVQSLTSMRRFFFAVTLLSTLMLFGAGLFAATTKRDTVLTSITFLVGFVGLVLTVIQTYPRITRHIRGSWRTFVRLAVVLFVLVSIAFTALVLQKPVIKIGISLPFSGGDKQDALPIFNAIKLAVDESNGKIGNYQIQLVPFDDSNLVDSVKLMSPETGRSPGSARPFADITDDAQVAAIIGPFKSGTAEDEIPLTNAAGIPLISPSTTVECLTDAICRGKKLGDTTTFFRTATTDSVRSKVLADYFAQQTQRVRNTVAIFTDGTSFGDGFAEYFAAEWKVQRPDYEQPEPRPLTDEADKDLKGLGFVPDLVLFAGTGPKGITLHEAMRLNPDYAQTAFAGAANIMNGGFNGHLQDHASGDVYAITPMPYDDTTTKIIKFRGDYNTSYGGEEKPTPYSASAYDATKILLAALSKAAESRRPPVATWNFLAGGQAKEFRAKIASKMRDVNRGKGIDYDGITGTIKFTGNGNVDYGTADKADNVSIYRYYSESRDGHNTGWNYEDFSLKK